MEGMIGEIRLFGSNFAPRAWAFCEGQLLPIAQNTALFSIIGTIYGGDGQTTFALPDMRGRTVLHPGTGPGLSTHPQGQKSGSEYNVLNVTQLPSHNHLASLSASLPVTAEEGDSQTPVGNVFAASGEGAPYATGSDGTMADSPASVTIAGNGGGQQVNNMQPYLAINYIICLQGVYPSRS